MVLRLRVEDLSIQSSPQCQSDYLQIYSAGYEPQSRRVSAIHRFPRHCGVNALIPFISNQAFLINFQSDETVNNKGFLLVVEKSPNICGGTLRTNGERFSSPLYPSSYQTRINCTWEILAPNPGFVINIQFNHIRLYGSASKFYSCFGRK